MFAFSWKISRFIKDDACNCIELHLLCHNGLKLNFSMVSRKLAMKYSGQLLKRGPVKSILSSSSKKRFVKFWASSGFVKLMTSSISIALPLFTYPGSRGPFSKYLIWNKPCLLFDKAPEMDLWSYKQAASFPCQNQLRNWTGLPIGYSHVCRELTL